MTSDAAAGTATGQGAGGAVGTAGGHSHRFQPVPIVERRWAQRAVARVASFGPTLVLAAFVLLVVAGLALSLVYGPPAIIEPEGLTAAERAEAQASLRTSLLQAAAGVALLVGLYYTARSSSLARQGQNSDRFTKAIEQLGHDSTDVRIGGLYALEHIARDSRRFRPAVVETIQRFIAGCCPEVTSGDEAPAAVRADAQVAVQILARRRGISLERQRLNFYALCLPRTRVDRGDLRLINAFYARLTGSSLVECNLRGAGFGWADFDQGFLSRSDLRRASFYSTNLEGTYLPGVDARWVDFGHANLNHADFSYRKDSKSSVYIRAAKVDHADFHRAHTDGANFSGVDLRKALNLTQEQIDVAIIDDATQLPSHISRPALPSERPTDGPRT